MNIRELVKIANKLDGLGLTKEADILDGVIRKSASHPGLGDFSPPDDIQKLMTAWLDYPPFPGLRSVIGYDERNDSAYIGRIERLCQYISDMADKDGVQRTGLSSWYSRNIETANIFTGSPDRFHQLITKDLYELADDIDDVIKNSINDSRRTSLSMYKDVVGKIRATASKWSSSFGREGERVERKPRPGSAAERGGMYSPGGGTQAMGAGATYPPYKEPKSNLTGWDKYTAKQEFGAAVQKAWNDFVAGKGAGQYNRSFGSFVSWYNKNKDGPWEGKHKSTQQVADILVADILGGMK